MMGKNKNKPKILCDQIKKKVQICLYTKTCTCMKYMKPYFLILTFPLLSNSLIKEKTVCGFPPNETQTASVEIANKTNTSLLAACL